MAGPAPQTMVYTVEHNGQVFDVEGPPNASPEQLQAFVAQSGASQAAPTDAQPNVVNNTQYEGQFGDDPNRVNTHLSPQDEAQYNQMLAAKGVTAEQLHQFLSERGLGGTDLAGLQKFVDAREAGQPINPEGWGYALPKVESTAASAIAGGIADIVPGAEKLGAAIDTVGNAIQNGGTPEGGWEQTYNRLADTYRAQSQADEQGHPWLRLSGQLFGGLAIPSALEGVGLRAGSEVLRAGGTMAEARTAARIAVARRSAEVGGGYGAAHGALGADSPGEALTGALTEGGLGAVAGAAIPAIGGALASRAANRGAGNVAGREVQQAADRLGIDVLPADVGGPMMRRATSAAAQTIAGGQPVINAAGRTIEQAQGASNRIAASIGAALRPEAAGQAGIRGARSFIARTSQRARQLYSTAVAEAGDARITPTRALDALDRNIGELAETPGGAAGLGRLQTLRDELARGDVSVAGLRNMRTTLRDDFAEKGLRGSDIERRVNQVIDATTQDVTQGLQAQGRPAAARAYQVADRYWRNRVQTIDDVLDPLITNKSGEQVVKTLTADLQGNNARAIAFLRALPVEEQSTVRASIIGAMGRATKGNQNADGDAFSLSSFLTNWNEIGDRAKNAYFGPEARAALNDLARVAQGSREAQGYANRSNTGGAVGNLLTLGTSVGGFATLGSTIAMQYGIGRLLSSPRFARWLARAPRTALSPEAYTERLTRIARAEPAIANEVLQLQERLASAFSDAPMRAAAQPSNEAGVADGNGGQYQPQPQGVEP